MNIVGDAALYQHFQGDDRAAIELVRDMLHLGESLRKNPKSNDLVPLLVSVGIDGLNMDRLMTIVSNVRLTNDPADTKALKTRDAAELIKQFLAIPTANETLKQIFENPAALNKEPELQRMTEVYNRTASDRGMAAMSLAAHLFRQERGSGPRLSRSSTMLPPYRWTPGATGRKRSDTW